MVVIIVVTLLVSELRFESEVGDVDAEFMASKIKEAFCQPF